jgi:predicted AAA+ superfamily ATPase
MYYSRTLSSLLENASQTFPVVLITSPCQVGKTTVFEKNRESTRTIGYSFA